MIMICDFLPKGANQVAALIAVAVLGILAAIHPDPPFRRGDNFAHAFPSIHDTI